MPSVLSAVFSGMLFAPSPDVVVPIVSLAPLTIGFIGAVKLCAFGVLALPISTTVTAAFFTVFSPLRSVALNGALAFVAKFSALHHRSFVRSVKSLDSRARLPSKVDETTGRGYQRVFTNRSPTGFVTLNYL